MEPLKERLNYELGVIQKMGYVDYFLIVWDFIKFARDHDIMVRPGVVPPREVWFPIPWELPSWIPLSMICSLNGF